MKEKFIKKRRVFLKPNNIILLIGLCFLISCKSSVQEDQCSVFSSEGNEIKILSFLIDSEDKNMHFYSQDSIIGLKCNVFNKYISKIDTGLLNEYADTNELLAKYKEKIYKYHDYLKSCDSLIKKFSVKKYLKVEYLNSVQKVKDPIILFSKPMLLDTKNTYFIQVKVKCLGLCGGTYFYIVKEIEGRIKILSMESEIS